MEASLTASKIIIASDHGGFELKQHLIPFLKGKGIEVLDLGTDSAQSVDYPDFAQKAVCAILEAGEGTVGILLCGMGIGTSITANRFKGIRCALCTNTKMAEMARRHNNANILSLGGRNTPASEAEKIVDVFLNTPFDGERHQRRVFKIDNPVCCG